MAPRRLGILAVLAIAGLSGVVAVAAGSTSADVTPAGVCQPELDAAWGVEAQEIRVPLVCSTGHVPGPRDAVLLDAPPGARLVGGEIVWTPGLDQAATYQLTVRIGHEEATVTVGVGDAWDDPDNVVPVDPAQLTHESALPVFHLVTDATIGPDTYGDAQITYLGHQYTATSAKLRGSLSLQYEKDNFTLRFDPADPFSDPTLPGLDGSTKLVLNGDFDDNSHLRNRLAFELWNSMSPAHLQVAHTSAVVYVNGRYTGLYTVTDQIGAEFLAEAGLVGGELYKTIGHRADFTSVPDSTLAGREIEQKVPDPDDRVLTRPAIFDLYDFVDRSGPATFRAEAAERLVLDDFIDWFVLVSLVGAGDSVEKNAYVYAPPGGLGFRAVPWDFNQSFGQDFATYRVAAGSVMPSELAPRNRLFERLLAEPRFAADIGARATAVLGGVGSAEAVEALTRRLGAEVGAAAARDEQRWSDAYRDGSPWADRTDFTSFDTELDYLVEWYAQRVPLLADDLDRITS